jgi:dihydrofolate reductase
MKDTSCESFFPCCKLVRVKFTISCRLPAEADSSKAPTYLTPNLSSATTRLSNLPIPTPIHHHFIIGGASIYASALKLTPFDNAYVDRVLLTRILEPEFGECDAFMPDFIAIQEERRWERAGHAELSGWVGFEVPEGVQEENGVKYEFQMWVR